MDSKWIPQEIVSAHKRDYATRIININQADNVVHLKSPEVLHGHIQAYSDYTVTF
jgi:hypothetical protein